MMDTTYAQNHPKEHQTMNDDVLFMKHLASGTDENSLWHLVVDHTTDSLSYVPVVRIRVYRGASTSDDSVVDLTISLESSYPLFRDEDYASFVEYRQARLKDAVAMLRVFALANHDENQHEDA